MTLEPFAFKHTVESIASFAPMYRITWGANSIIIIKEVCMTQEDYFIEVFREELPEIQKEHFLS